MANVVAMLADARRCWQTRVVMLKGKGWRRRGRAMVLKLVVACAAMTTVVSKAQHDSATGCDGTTLTDAMAAKER